jgi:23S rRNA (cytidine1920-2'-O)/16S rRNA (cytidine1409-2'-O)-methyltransferase
MKKQRADELVAKIPEVGTRSQARLLIMAGKVRVNGSIVAKGGDLYAVETVFELEQPPKFVGRGGLKLEGALDRFGLDPSGLVFLDVGASTGGFTDCLLQRGAKKVYCIDVGTAQLAPKIFIDPRVFVMDKTNARYLETGMFDEKPNAAVVDVSFITGDKVIAPLKEILASPAWIVWLLKPQFEAGPGKVGKGGVIRNLDNLREAIKSALDRIVSIPCVIRGITESPIKGADGNREYLVWLEFSDVSGISSEQALLQSMQPSQ